MSNKDAVMKKSGQILNLSKTGVLLISPILAAQITALHEDCGRNEWSGVLLFREINGDRENPENFRAVAEGCFPMNYGTGAYTEYDHSEKSLEVFERYPKADPESNRNPWKLGQIHTHHDMGAFFSGTDDGELRDNANKYPYYLSLVVDFKGTYKAKVAFIAKKKSHVEYKKKNKWFKVQTEPEEVLVTFDLKVKMDLDAWFFNQMQEVDKDSRKVSHTSYSGPSYSNHSRTNSVVKSTSVNEANKTKESLYSRVREHLPMLFSAGGKSRNFYWMFEDIGKLLKTEAEIELFFKDRLASANVDGWLYKYFQDDVAGNIYGEQHVLETAIKAMTDYTSQDKLMKEAIRHLKVYVEFTYNWDDKSTDKDDDKIESKHNIDTFNSASSKTALEEYYETLANNGDD